MRTIEYGLKCPICSGTLMVYERNNGMLVLDGNTVIECINDKKHKFWKNAREYFGILHLDENASQTKFYSEKTFIWNKEKEIFEEEIQ